MQIYIIGTIEDTIKSMDNKRLNNQATELRLTLDCLYDLNGWWRQPLMHMYSGHQMWLEVYLQAIKAYKNKKYNQVTYWSNLGEAIKPVWFCEEFYNMHKSRLYTKDPEHYKQWSNLGTSYSNWYMVNGKWVEYKQK